jgi:hypothetical protein
MDSFLEANRVLHIVFAIVGLAAWWVPILTKKGGEHHKSFGKAFALCAYVVGITAVVGATTRLVNALSQGAVLRDNVEAFGLLVFLAYLGLLTLAVTHFAVQTVRTRQDPAAIGTPLLLGLTGAMVAGSVVSLLYAFLLWSSVSIVLLALGPIGLIVGRNVFNYVYRRPPEKMAWWYAHMGAMFGAGIAFHTAFLVFGSREVLDLSILGPFSWVPWVVPSIIGIGGGEYWKNRYRSRFRSRFGGRAEAGAGA